MKIPAKKCGFILVMILVSNLPSFAIAKNVAAESNMALAKAVQNLLLPLKSFMTQYIETPNTGFFHRKSEVMNLQLIYPINFNSQWNIITRSILPVVSQPPLFPGQFRIEGTSSLLTTAYFSPKHPGAFRWGVGPAVVFPTESNEFLGYEKWGGGISGIIVSIHERLVYGGFLTQVWSKKNISNQRLNRMYIQPAINYNFPSGYYLTSLPIITCDWERKHNQWLIPVGGGIGRVVKINNVPINFVAQAFYHAKKPALVGDWSFRLQAQIFFKLPDWL